MKSKLIKYSFWIFVNLVWIGMVFALVNGAFLTPQGGVRAPQELMTRVELVPETSWMGVYINSLKIGYINTEIEPVDESRYEIREYSSLKGAMMGVGQAMKMRMTVVTDSTLALVSFDGLLEAGSSVTEFKGSVEKKVLSVQVTTAGKTSERFIPAAEPIYLSQAIKPLLQRGRLGEMDSLVLAGFDPLSLQMQELVVIGAELQKHMLWGREEYSRKLTTRMAGFESTVYVDALGNIMAEMGPMGMTMRREDMETAMAYDDNSGNQVDFLTIYSIKPVGSIPSERATKSARYKIRGVDLNMIVEASDRQSIIDSTEKIIDVSILSERHWDDVDLTKYLTDAPFIESREPRIINAAITAVRKSPSRLDSLKRLSQWVYSEIRKSPSAGIPSALAVLSSKQGDCNEHSILFTAMARSLGIPTRILLGVVYQNERFYYHAWPASWIGGKWVEFDPTFGQVRADAARIALTAGDMTDAIKLASVVGNLEIEILDTQW